MKKIIAMLLVLAMAFGLVACGGSEAPAETKAPEAAAPAENAGPTAVTLKVWAPQADQVDENSWLNVMLPKFEEAHPEYTITWDIGVCGEGDAAGIVKNDPAAAADVFLYANDQMGTLIEAGALAKLGGSYLEQVQNDVAQTYIDTVTYTDGGVYGFPMAPNTWFMWYNKDIFTEEDVKNLNTMLEKGVVSFPMDNSWYTATFFFGVGGTLYGPQGIDAAAGIDFSSDLCVEAGKFMIDFAKHPNFKNDVDGAGVAGMLDEVQVEATFPDGTKLVTVHNPIQQAAPCAKIGEVTPADGEIILNEGKVTATVVVANKGDRPVQVGSHYHFFEVNRCLDFDREKAFGFHLDIPSGTSVRFEPGEEKEVQLVAMGGSRIVYGLNDLTCGSTAEDAAAAMETAKAKGFVK